MPIECERWEWRELLASEQGPPDPGTRLVLFVIALYMNKQGDGAWPSQTTIAARTGMSDRSVRKHLKIAVRLGWLEISPRRRTGQAWFVNAYGATIPHRLAALVKSKPWEDDPKWQRPANSSARSPKEVEHPEKNAQRGEVNDATGGNSCRDARQNLPTNSSSEHSINTSKERAAHAGAQNALSEEEKRKTEDRRLAEEAEKARAATESAQAIARIRARIAPAVQAITKRQA